MCSLLRSASVEDGPTHDGSMARMDHGPVREPRALPNMARRSRSPCVVARPDDSGGFRRDAADDGTCAGGQSVGAAVFRFAGVRQRPCRERSHCRESFGSRRRSRSNPIRPRSYARAYSIVNRASPLGVFFPRRGTSKRVFAPIRRRSLRRHGGHRVLRGAWSPRVPVMQI